MFIYAFTAWKKTLSVRMTIPGNLEGIVSDYQDNDQLITDNRSSSTDTGQKAHLQAIQAFLDRRQLVSKTERKPPEDCNGIAFLEAIHAFWSGKKVTMDTDIEKRTYQEWLCRGQLSVITRDNNGRQLLFIQYGWLMTASPYLKHLSSTSRKMTENARNKLKKIIHFCKSFGYADHDNISQCIRATLDDAPDKVISFIDLIWKVLKGLDGRKRKEVIVEGIQILSSTLSLLGLHIPMMSIASNVVSLGGFLLKIVFCLTDFESVLNTKNKALDTIQHELAGLAARLERTEKFIDLVDSQECTGKYTLKMLRNDIDMQIGVEQIGNLKSRSKSLMSGKMEDWYTALELIKLFVRISTLRHSLLIRILTCLKSNNFIPATDTAIQKHIKEERRKNQRFLSSFFSVPSLETVGILAIYDPTKEEEIDTYIKDMGLSYQNLRATLHDIVVQLIPFSNTSIVCGRPIFSFWSTMRIGGLFLFTIWQEFTNHNLNSVAF
uniref:Uncharacterized protein n=1 Tax=Magallana gigas TaxID=29159 RepID=A0A8W8J4B3_MAGGI